jgi:hypothetical protein
MSSKELKELEEMEFIEKAEDEYLYNQYLIAEAIKIQQGADRLLRMVTEHLEKQPNEFKDLEDNDGWRDAEEKQQENESKSAEDWTGTWGGQ